MAHEAETSAAHELLILVVDEASQRIATVQNYVGALTDGSSVDRHNSNFFEVGPDGRFRRVFNWAGPNKQAS